MDTSKYQKHEQMLRNQKEWIALAGFPTITENGGKLLVTTEPAPITELLPIEHPLRIDTPCPIQTSSPIEVGDERSGLSTGHVSNCALERSP